MPAKQVERLILLLILFYWEGEAWTSDGKKRTGWRKKRKRKGDTGINESDTDELEKSRNEAVTFKRSVHCKKDLAMIFNQSPKWN